MRKGMKLGIIGLVLASCCLLSVIVAALGGGDTASTPAAQVQATEKPEATAVPTAKPEPTTDPIEACKPQVRGYLSTQMIVSRLLAESMQLVSEGDLVGGYKEFDRARLAFGATTPPDCDMDTQVLHNKMDVIVSTLEVAFTSLAAGDFETASGYIKETGPIISEMTEMVENIGRKYDF